MTILNWFKNYKEIQKSKNNISILHLLKKGDVIASGIKYDDCIAFPKEFHIIYDPDVVGYGQVPRTFVDHIESLGPETFEHWNDGYKYIGHRKAKNIVYKKGLADLSPVVEDFLSENNLEQIR